MYDFDLVCIGSGPAGQRAAVQAAKLGRRGGRRREAALASVGRVHRHRHHPEQDAAEAVVTFSGLAGQGRPPRPGRRLEARPTCQQLFAGVDRVIAREVEVIESQLRRNDVSVLSGRGVVRGSAHAGDRRRAAAGAGSPPSTS